MINRHVEDEATRKVGMRQGGGGQGSAFLIGVHCAAPEDRQAETGTDCRLGARHAFDFAHDIKVSSEYQGLPLKENADPVPASGQDQWQAQRLLDRQRDIGREVPGRSDDVEPFVEERRGCRLGDIVQRHSQIVDTRIHRRAKRLAVALADRQADFRESSSAFLDHRDREYRANGAQDPERDGACRIFRLFFRRCFCLIERAPKPEQRWDAPARSGLNTADPLELAYWGRGVAARPAQTDRLDQGDHRDHGH